MDKRIFILVSCIFIWWSGEYAQAQKSFNVVDFGAVGDGNKDDSEAFVKAWNATCGASSRTVVLQIPEGKTFMVKPMKLQGPCKSSNITIEVSGQLVAPNVLSDYPKPTPDSWLQLSNVDGLTINGGGTIDGRGQVWWDTCKGNVCPRRPATAAFIDCNNLKLQNLKFLNSSGNHISIISCVGVSISELNIQAPENSINTDGIDITFSSGILIHNSTMATGDDCVAITNESHSINITQVTCGPGHGVSIGSLGKGGGNDTVEDVHVKNCTFIGTQNGARIKTWQGGSGFARNITFEDILLHNASNPIIIDQFYCPEHDCKNQTSAVKISDITYRNVVGTTNSEMAIVLHCSQTIGCTNIQMDQINITSSIPGKHTLADCFDAHVEKGSTNPNVICKT